MSSADNLGPQPVRLKPPTSGRECFDRLVEALTAKGCRVKETRPGKAEAQCPAHDDRNSSLSIEAKEDKVLLRCHAGCSFRDVVEQAGVRIPELFANWRRRSDPEAAAAAARDVYTYSDAAGCDVGRLLRSPRGGRSWQLLDAGCWEWGMPADCPLYRGPEVSMAVRSHRTVWVCEGESDAEAVASIGVVATTAPGGAASWSERYTAALAAAFVVIVADRDHPGYTGALAKLDALEGVAAGVIVVEPRVGDDIRDHLEAGHKLDQVAILSRADLDARIAATRPVPLADAQRALAQPGRFRQKSGATDRVVMEEVLRAVGPEGDTNRVVVIVGAIACATFVSPRTVGEALRRLVAAGWLAPHRREGHLYRVTIPAEGVPVAIPVLQARARRGAEGKWSPVFSHEGLGYGAGLVHRLLGGVPVTPGELASFVGMNDGSVRKMLHTLARWDLAVEGPRGWRRGPVSPDALAVSSGLHRLPQSWGRWRRQSVRLHRAWRYRSDRILDTQAVTREQLAKAQAVGESSEARRLHRELADLAGKYKTVTDEFKTERNRLDREFTAERRDMKATANLSAPARRGMALPARPAEAA